MAEIFRHLQGGDPHALRLQQMTDPAAEKAILVVPSFFRRPGNVRLLRVVQQPLAADTHTVAHPAEVTVDVPVGGIVTLLRKRPGGTDIVVIQEFLPPHFRVHYETIRMDEQNELCLNVIAQLIHALVIEIVYAGKAGGMPVMDPLRQKQGLFIRDDEDIRKMDSPHAVFQRLHRRAHLNAGHGAEGDVGKLKLFTFFHGCFHPFRFHNFISAAGPAPLAWLRSDT